jgi:hypothetical protein
LAGAIAVGVAVPRAAVRAPRLLVAAVRGERLYPIARFDGSAWVTTWPVLDEEYFASLLIDRIPPAWLAGPVPETWTAWTAAGTRVGALRVTRTAERRGGGCTEAIELAAADPASDAAALATAGDGTANLQTLATQKALEPEARSAIDNLVAAHQAAILATQRQWSPGEREALEAALRTATPRVVFASTHQSDGSQLAMFSADKAGEPRISGAYGVHVDGWIREDSSRHVVVMQFNDRIISTEMMVSIKLLGVIRMNGREYWFLNSQGYEGSAFMTVEVSTAGVRQVVRASYSGC